MLISCVRSLEAGQFQAGSVAPSAIKNSRVPLTPIRWLLYVVVHETNRKTEKKMRVGEDVKPRNHCAFWVLMLSGATAVEKVWQSLKLLK